MRLRTTPSKTTSFHRCLRIDLHDVLKLSWNFHCILVITTSLLQATSDALRLEERALVRYDAILDLLGTLAPAAQSQEAQP